MVEVLEIAADNKEPRLAPGLFETAFAVMIHYGDLSLILRDRDLADRTQHRSGNCEIACNRNNDRGKRCAGAGGREPPDDGQAAGGKSPGKYFHRLDHKRKRPCKAPRDREENAPAIWIPAG